MKYYSCVHYRFLNLISYFATTATDKQQQLGQQIPPLWSPAVSLTKCDLFPVLICLPHSEGWKEIERRFPSAQLNTAVKRRACAYALILVSRVRIAYAHLKEKQKEPAPPRKINVKKIETQNITEMMWS